MRNLEACWNSHKLQDDTFADRPTKLKMPADYAKDIRAAARQGLLDPENDAEDCQLLFAYACGTMLGFRGNQVCGESTAKKAYLWCHSSDSQMKCSCPKAEETTWLIDQLVVAFINLGFEAVICAIVASFLGFIFGPFCAQKGANQFFFERSEDCVLDHFS
jgi:hypothetical protein